MSLIATWYAIEVNPDIVFKFSIACQIGLDLQHLLNIELHEVVKSLIVAHEQDLDRWHILLVLLHRLEELAKKPELQFALVFLLWRSLGAYFLAENEFEIRHVVLGNVARVLVVFSFWVRLRRSLYLHFHDLVLERLEDLVSHILHHVFVGYLDCMLKQLLGQMLVNVPDQATGHLL